MNTFKIYFKENTVLNINDTKKTFIAGTMYGFKFISDKDMKNIRKQIIGNPNVMFYLTDDLLGCYQIVNGNKKPKDISSDNLITMNRGKKNKGKKTAYATKASIEAKLEEADNIPDEEPISSDTTPEVEEVTVETTVEVEEVEDENR